MRADPLSPRSTAPHLNEAAFAFRAQPAHVRQPLQQMKKKGERNKHVRRGGRREVGRVMHAAKKKHRSSFVRVDIFLPCLAWRWRALCSLMYLRCTTAVHRAVEQTGEMRSSRTLAAQPRLPLIDREGVKATQQDVGTHASCLKKKNKYLDCLHGLRTPDHATAPRS